MARTYKRDSRGRFAGGGGGSSRGGGRKPLQRGTNRLTRDNAGRITSVGGDGATARGGRLRTASGKQRATQTARISGGRAAGTVTRSGARRTAAAAVKPAATKLQRSGRKSRIENLSTNQEMGRKGIVSMSPRAKSVRSAAVAERKAERVSRIAERQTGIVARRQINRASNYNPDGTFNQSAANANQRRLKRSQQLQEKLRTAGTGASIASNALSKRRSNQRTASTVAAATTPPSKLKRSGKTIKIAQKKAPTPTKEDKSIEKVRNLKAAQPAFGRGQSGAVFVPDKALTPKRRQALGLSAFASRAESQRWSVSRQQFGSQSGVLISERGGYRASLPKQRQGVIKRPTNPTTRAAAAAVKPASITKPAAGSLAATRIEQSKGRASVLSQQKSALNKQLKQINAQIKEAGPSAGGLRLQKLQIQDRLSQTRRALSAAQAAAKPAATAKPASKLGFTQSDFARRSQRTASIRNPQVKAKAQQLYGKILDLNSTPRQLKSMFKKAGKPKQRTATAATRQMRREHQNMMAASKVLFK